MRWSDNSSVVVTLKIIIGHKRVGADRRTFLDMFADVAVKLWPARVWHNRQNHAGMFVRRCPFQDTLHSGLFESRMADA
jgi:hypothetical protein